MTARQNYDERKRFGLGETHYCDSRHFFRKMNHPGANNCACPKFDDGASCVPRSMWDAWFAYIGLTDSTKEGA